MDLDLGIISEAEKRQKPASPICSKRRISGSSTAASPPGCSPGRPGPEAARSRRHEAAGAARAPPDTARSPGRVLRGPGRATPRRARRPPTSPPCPSNFAGAYNRRPRMARVGTSTLFAAPPMLAFAVPSYAN